MAFRSFQGPDFSFDSLSADGGPLAPQLAAWAERAAAAGRVPCVYLTASWCPPSVRLEKSLGDPLMQRALREVEAATLDVDAWGDRLGEAGFSARSVPVFFAVDAQGKASGPSITGAAWNENTPENMAPPLERFFDPLRAARVAEQRHERAVMPAPPAAPSRALAIAMVIFALLLVVGGATLKVYLDGQQQAQDNAAERDERIRQNVERTIQDSLKKK